MVTVRKETDDEMGVGCRDSVNLQIVVFFWQGHGLGL